MTLISLFLFKLVLLDLNLNWSSLCTSRSSFEYKIDTWGCFSALLIGGEGSIVFVRKDWFSRLLFRSRSAERQQRKKTPGFILNAPKDSQPFNILCPLWVTLNSLSLVLFLFKRKSQNSSNSKAHQKNTLEMKAKDEILKLVTNFRTLM